MNFMDFLVIAIIAAILISVTLYIRKAKKKGVKCIGCPNGASCGGHCSGCSGCCGSAPKF